MSLNELFEKQGTRLCRICKNHGLNLPTAGHKKDCKYKNCQCDMCLMERDRQTSSKISIKNYRKEAKKKETSKENARKLKLVLRMLNECKPTIMKIIASYLEYYKFNSKMQSDGLNRGN